MTQGSIMAKSGKIHMISMLHIVCIGLSLSNEPTPSSPSQSLKEPSMTFDYKNQGDSFWKKHLAPEVYYICRQHGTEISRSGKYDKFYERGTYYCACCGGDHPVYNSEEKFDSGTGWPSFYRPVEGGVIERPDPNDILRGWVGLARTEVICARCESHLGHVFDDVDKTKGRRYCMNSQALTFTPENKTPERTFDINE